MQELLNGQASVRDDAAQSARADLLMIRNDHAGIGFLTPQDHVAAGLTPEYKPRTFKRGAHLAARQVGGKLGQVPEPLRSFDFDEFLACLGGHRVAGDLAVLDI